MRARATGVENYKFSQPFESYVETCTSFYVFFWMQMADRLGRLLDPYPTALLFVHFPLLDTPDPASLPSILISNNCMSWFGAICPLWQAPVPFLNAAKLLIL
jgi:hypothetical protein